MTGRESTRVALWLTVAWLLLPLSVSGCAQTTSLDSRSVEPEPSASPTMALHVGTRDEVLNRIAGIRPGAMVDAAVVALYGPGAVYGKIPYARYYTDPAHRVTLMSAWHTDHMVMTVTLTRGTVLPPGVDPARTVTSLSTPVAIDKGIALGMTPRKVIARLGEPQYDSASVDGVARTLSYEVWADDPSKAGWISYNAVLEFENNRLHSVTVSAGD